MQIPVKLDLCSFDKALQSKLESALRKLNARIQRTLSGPITPNAETFFSVRKFRKKEELRALAVLSWYLSDGYGDLLRLDLNEKIKQISLPVSEKETLFLLMNSKKDCLIFLRKSYSDRGFYGNFLPLTERIANNLYFLSQEPHRAKRKVRRRGYRDHGSCRPESRWLPSSDFSFTEEMNLKEQEDLQLQRTLSSIESFGCLGVRLPVLES